MPRYRKEKYTIGDWVRVTHTTHFHYESGNRKVRVFKLHKPRIGQISGLRTRYEGRKEYHGYDEPSEFVQTKGVKIWLVAECLRGTPLEAQEEHIEPLPVEEIPKRLTITRPCEQHQQWSREIANTMKRDEKGRFIRD